MQLQRANANFKLIRHSVVFLNRKCLNHSTQLIILTSYVGIRTASVERLVMMSKKSVSVTRRLQTVLGSLFKGLPISFAMVKDRTFRGYEADWYTYVDYNEEMFLSKGNYDVKTHQDVVPKLLNMANCANFLPIDNYYEEVRDIFWDICDKTAGNDDTHITKVPLPASSVQQPQFSLGSELYVAQT